MKHTNENGFTLFELIICLAISVIILGFGIPAFSTAIENSQRKNTVYELMGILNFARSTAVNMSKSVVICPSDNQKHCASTRNWNASLLIFADLNKNNVKDEGEVVLRVMDMNNNNQSLNWKSFGNKSYLAFNPYGTTGFQSGRIYYCFKDGKKPNHRSQVIVYRTGRVRIAALEELKSGC